MKFQYKVKGVILDVYDLININEYYEAACTAEYLMDNYGITNEDKAMRLGSDVRRYMNKNNVTEDVAIEEIMRRR